MKAAVKSPPKKKLINYFLISTKDYKQKKIKKM